MILDTTSALHSAYLILHTRNIVERKVVMYMLVS